MFEDYFKIAWRNIIQSKGYSALNVVDLATGMAVALVIGLGFLMNLATTSLA